MHSAAAATEALLILFLMSVCGWVLRARRVLTLAAMPALSAIALDVALPCLVFTVLVFKKSLAHACEIMKLSMTEVQGHMTKGKWG